MRGNAPEVGVQEMAAEPRRHLLCASRVSNRYRYRLAVDRGTSQHQQANLQVSMVIQWGERGAGRGSGGWVGCQGRAGMNVVA